MKKNGSFGFAKGLDVSWEKAKCAVCGLAKNFKFFCAVGGKIKTQKGRSR
jgi:hypothetical protein